MGVGDSCVSLLEGTQLRHAGPAWERWIIERTKLANAEADGGWRSQGRDGLHLRRQTVVRNGPWRTMMAAYAAS